MSDYYEIMGIDRNATKDEIKSAFRKMAKIQFPEEASLWDIAGVFGAFIGIVSVLGILSGVLLKNQAIAGVAVMAGFLVTAAASIAIVAIGFAQLSKDISPSQMAAALAIMIAFGAIVAVLAVIGSVLAHTGIGAGGMALVALIIAAIGFACIGAGVGIALFVSSISNLVDFNSGESKTDIGVDDQMPILNYCFVKAQPERIFSNCKYHFLF